MDGVSSGRTTLNERLRALVSQGWPLLALALGVRVVEILATPHWTPAGDPADYVRHAVSIAHGHGMADSQIPAGGPSAIRPPAYPYFLGGVFAVTGDSQTAGRIAAALIGVVTVVLIGLIADTLWNRRVALWAMGLGAVYPPLVLVSGTLLSETLALPLMLALLALLLEYSDRSRPGWVAPVAGLLFALCLLDRPALSVLAVPLVAGLWARRAHGLGTIRAPAVALVVAGLAIVPWTIRNAREFHDFVPISTQSGFLVAGTYNVVSDHDPNLPGAYRPASLVLPLLPLIADRSLDENELSKKLGKTGRDYAKDHPGYVPRVLWWNGLRVLSISHGVRNDRFAYSFQGIGRGPSLAATIGWYLAVALALAGILFGALRSGPWWFWITPPLLFLSVIWISGDVRYRLPIEPFVIWAAAFALARLTDRRRAPLPPPMQQPR